MYKERKQIISKSLDSIRYLHLHDALPHDFPVEIRKYQTSEKFIFSISAKQNKWAIDYNFFGIRDLDVTKIYTSRLQVSESKLPLMTTDEMFRISKISDILREYQHESSLERFYGHFDSKGCFSAQILPSSPTGLLIKLSCDCRNLAVNSLKFLFS